MSKKLLSESEAAHRFCQLYQSEIRYVPELKTWMLLYGRVWQFDESKAIDSLIRGFLDEQEGIDPRWKGSLNVVRNVKGLAELDPSIHAKLKEIDARDDLIGTGDRVYNLRKGRFIRPRNGTYVTKSTSVEPNFDAECRRWLRFLKEISEGHKPTIAYLKRYCGYLLTGSMKEQCFLILYGPGQNGKSVFVNTISKVMGDYHKEALPETFVESGRKAHETALAHISGSRFVTSGESDQGGSFNEATIKRVTGADTIAARLLFKNPFNYRPTYKVWVTTNHLPRLKSVGPDMRRRVQLLELGFVPKRRDLDLEDKLTKEHGAILAWMIEGAKEWYEEGLSPPRAIINATDAYFEDQDTLGTWIKEATRKAPGYKSATSHLCASYNRFLAERGLPEIHPSVFGRLMVAKGYKIKNTMPTRIKRRSRCVLDLRLRLNT